MSELLLSTDEFMEQVPSQFNVVGRVLCFSMLSGILVFLGAILFFFFQQGPLAKTPTADQEQMMKILSMVNVGLIFGSFMGFLFLPKLLLAPLKQIQSIQSVEEKRSIYLKSATLFRISLIVRLAILEGGALFGLIVCFLSNESGLLKQMPTLWLNAIPAGIFFLLILTFLPTENRLRNWFEDEIQPIFKAT